MSACAISSPDGTKWQGAGPNASPVMWSMGNAGSCPSNADHSTHRCVPCDENQSESRMPEIGTSGSMSGAGKRGVAEWPKLPRPSSTLPIAPFREDSYFGPFWREADIELPYLTEFMSTPSCGPAAANLRPGPSHHL